MPTTTPSSALSFVFNAAALFAPTGKPFVVSIATFNEGGYQSGAIPHMASVDVDATLRESHSYQNQITEHPVEQGMDVTDYIRVRPSSLTIEGIVTDTPSQNPLLGAAVSGAASMLSGVSGQTGQILGGILAGAAVAGALVDAALTTGFTQPARSQAAYNQLVALSQSQQLVQVSTPLKVWSNMAFETLTVDRDKDTGAALSFHATLKEIMIVSTQLVSAALPGAVANLGHKNPTKAGGGFQSGDSALYAPAKATANSLFPNLVITGLPKRAAP